MTIDDAKNLGYGEILHYTGPGRGKPSQPCTRTIGPRGGVKDSIMQVRVTGSVKLWKTDPNRIRVPVKYGMYESAAIEAHNVGDFHRAADCPLNQEGV